MRPRRSTPVAAALAAAVLGAACGGPGAAAPHPSTTGRPPTTVGSGAPLATAPAAAASTTASAWTRAAAPQLAMGGGPTTTLAGVVAPASPGDLWVAVGTRLAGDGTGQATVFTSPDARAWTATSLSGAGVSSEAAAVTSFNGTTTVAGSVGSGAARRAAVWTAPSTSATFTEVPDQAAFAAVSPTSGAGARIDAVAAGAVGIVATGTAGGQPAVWYSTDDRRFSRDTAAEKVIAASPAPVVRALLVDREGVFAAGSTGTGAAMQAAVWTSSDGIEWKAEPSPQGVFAGGGAHRITGLVSVAREASRLTLAVGSVDTGTGWSPASWLSLDGMNWSTPSLSFPVSQPAATATLPGGVTADAVTSSPAGFVAVGGGAGDPMAWTSADGRSWQPQALPAPAATAPWHPDLVAATGTTTLIGDRLAGDAHLLVDGPAGWSQPTTDATTWGTPAAVATPVAAHGGTGGVSLVVDVRQPAQALGPATDTVEELTSADGAAWGVVPVPAFAGVRLVGGSVTPTGPAVVVGDASGAAVAFRSADGTTWQPLALGAGLATADAAAVLADGSALVAGTGPLPAVSAAPLATVVAAPAAAGQAAAPAAAGQAAAGQAAAGQAAAPVPLDPGDLLASARPAGACATPAGAAVVGAVATAGSVEPMASLSADGRSWQPATVAAPGAASMAGCAANGGALVAWGETTGASGARQPALWTSADARSWAAQGVAAFDQAGAGDGSPGLAALATSAAGWLAVGGTATAPSTAPGAGVGLWTSGDGGRSFSRVDTAVAPFAAAGAESLDVAAWLGTTAVVAGSVDGRLAVFTAAGS